VHDLQRQLNAKFEQLQHAAQKISHRGISPAQGDFLDHI
jgi:hypothetical protein